jgi:hypothetical protein
MGGFHYYAAMTEQQGFADCGLILWEQEASGVVKPPRLSTALIRPLISSDLLRAIRPE